MRIVDLKCPGSGESERNRWENLALLREADQLKFVLRDEADYRWALERIEEHRLAGRCTLLFSPVHGELDPADLAGWMLRDRAEARLQLQVHKILWPAVLRGV